MSWKISWLLIGLLIIACRDKDDDSDSRRFDPPYGVIASAVGGELAFFDLDNLEFITLEGQEGWATACELQSINGRLVTIDSEAGGFAVYELPEVAQVQHLGISGTPIDLKLDRSQLSAHVITRNGLYFRIAFSNLQADTIDTGPQPRRIALQPPNDFVAWIPSLGDSSIHVYQMQGFFEHFRIDLPAPCTDVCFKSDGSAAFCALPGLDNIYLLDAGDGRFIDSLSFNSTTVDLAMSHDGRYLAAADSNSGDVKIWDLTANTSGLIRCGSGAMRVRYSSTQYSFFVICTEESWVLNIDPTTNPPTVSDTLIVTSSPRCMSFRE